MAHRHHHHHRRRHNPFGVSSGIVKDVLWEIGGFAGANYGSGFIGQSGWMDVLATAGVALALGYVGRAIGAGGNSSDELVKGGLFAAGLKAVKHTGISVPGLGIYVPSYFSVPTSSDAYGRATSPIALLPAANPGTRTLGASQYGRYRSRFQGRF